MAATGAAHSTACNVHVVRRGLPFRDRTPDFRRRGGLRCGGCSGGGGCTCTGAGTAAGGSLRRGGARAAGGARLTRSAATSSAAAAAAGLCGGVGRSAATATSAAVLLLIRGDIAASSGCDCDHLIVGFCKVFGVWFIRVFYDFECRVASMYVAWGVFIVFL